MKIIEYTLGLPPYRRGGLTEYSVNLSLELAKKNEVFLMYPGSINPFSNKLKIVLKKTNYPFKLVELRNGLPVSLGLGIDNNNIDKFIAQRNIDEFKRFINRSKPDVVHFHTLMGVPKEVLNYLQEIGIKTVFTTHDFYGLCPKMLAKDPMSELINSRCTDDCMLCKIGPSYTKMIIMQTHFYENFKESNLVKKLRQNGKTYLNKNENNEKFSKKQILLRFYLRQFYLDMYKLIDEFHFNSSVARDYWMKFLPEANGKILPITHSGLTDNRKRKYENHDNLILGYVGPYDHKKGFFRMIRLSKHFPNVTMKFYGDIINNDIFDKKNIINFGIVSQKQLAQAYRDMDILIVPSLWHETFGFVVLEALLQGTPCLVSDLVGSKDLLPPEWIFDNDKELVDKIKELMENENLVLARDYIRKIKLNYSMIDHVQNIKKIFYEN